MMGYDFVAGQCTHITASRLEPGHFSSQSAGVNSQGIIDSGSGNKSTLILSPLTHLSIPKTARVDYFVCFPISRGQKSYEFGWNSN